MSAFRIDNHSRSKNAQYLFLNTIGRLLLICRKNVMYIRTALAIIYCTSVEIGLAILVIPTYYFVLQDQSSNFFLFSFKTDMANLINDIFFQDRIQV